VTWKPGSKSLGRPGGVPQVRPAREASKQEGRSESERTSRRNNRPHEAGSSGVSECQGFVASTRWPVPLRKNWDARSGLPAEAEGGNPGQYSSESPEGEEGRQDDPKNVKDRAYNRRMPGSGGESSWLADEVGKRGSAGQHNPDGARTSGRRWRWRGQGAAHWGGITRAQSWSSKGGANAGAERGHGGISLNPGGAAEGSVPNWTVPAAWSRTVGKPDVRILGGAAGNVI